MAQNTNKPLSFARLVPFLPIIVGVLAVILIVANVTEFPYTGLAVMSLIIINLAYFTRNTKTPASTLYFAFGLIFSILLFIKSNERITVLNAVVLTFLFCILMFDNIQKRFSVLSYLIAPALAFFQLVKHLLSYAPDNLNPISKIGLAENEPANSIDKRLSSMFKPTFIVQILISAIVLIVVLPILASSNVLFERLIESLFSWLDLQNLVTFLFGKSIFEFILRIIVLVLFSVLTWFVTTYRRSQEIVIHEQETASDYFTIPRIVLAVILGLFFITEIQLYFATPELLIEMGYSNSTQTREIFGQLAVVCLVVFALIYSQGKSLKHHKIITSILLLEAVFLNTIALNSDLTYIRNWGFTHSRLWGLAFVIWVYGVFALFAVQFFAKALNRSLKEKFDIKFQNFSIARAITIWALTVYLLINFLNFDYIIYHFSPHTEKGIDNKYMAYKLSYDARSYKNHLLKLDADYLNVCTEDNLKGKDEAYIESFNNAIIAASEVRYKLYKVQEDYKEFDIRVFNLYRFLAYMDAMSLDLNKYGDSISKCDSLVFKSYKGPVDQ